jgi:hypothetical protein
MVDADLAHLDAGLAHRIMLKRQMELTRRQQLLNAKHRVLGQDKDALDAQVAEKRQNDADDEEEKQQHSLTSKYLDKVCQLQDEHMRKEQHDMEKECREFSLTHLRKEQRKEFWLSDPETLRRERPLTIEEGLALPPASIAKLNNKYEPPEVLLARKRQQQAELRAALEAQMRDNRGKEEDDLRHDAEYADEAKRNNLLRTHIEQTQTRTQREEELATVRFNAGLSKHNAGRKDQQKERQAEAEQAELDFQMASPMLSEETECEYGLDGRVLPKTFKRMTRDQRQAILTQQAYQMVEARDRRRQEQHEDALFAEQLERQRLCLETVEAARVDRQNQKRVEAAEGYLEERRAQAEEQQKLKNVYANKISPEFYAQFGTRAR